MRVDVEEVLAEADEQRDGLRKVFFEMFARLRIPIRVDLVDEIHLASVRWAVEMSDAWDLQLRLDRHKADAQQIFDQIWEKVEAVAVPFTKEECS